MSRLAQLALLAALALLPLALGADPYLLNALITTGILTIGAISLNLLLGYTGQLSLGHVAFFGIGAYVSALTSLGFDVDLGFGLHVAHDPWPAAAGFALAVAAAGLCGYAIGRLSFRVRGAYFVIVTISFAEVARLVALNWVELTQGPLALTGIPAITLGLPGVATWALRTKLQNYYLVLAVATLCYLMVRRLVGSHFGRAMRGLKENEALARSVGIDATRTLTVAMVVSAAMAGAAGSMYAHYLRIIDPDVFAFTTTVTMVIMVVAGGKGTLMGPVVGGLVFGLLPVALRPVMAPEAQWMVYGAALILILFLMPRGIVPGVAGLVARHPHPPRVAETSPAAQP